MEELLKWRSDIAIITETKKKNEGSEDIGNYVMIYCGVPANQWASSGVAVAIRRDWKHTIQDYTWISDRIIESGHEHSSGCMIWIPGFVTAFCGHGR